MYIHILIPAARIRERHVETSSSSTKPRSRQTSTRRGRTPGLQQQTSRQSGGRGESMDTKKAASTDKGADGRIIAEELMQEGSVSTPTPISTGILHVALNSFRNCEVLIFKTLFT